MKNKKLKELIQKPLRFHHQDIHEEIDDLKTMITELSYNLIELKKELNDAKNSQNKEVKSNGCAKCGTGTIQLTS